MLSNLSVLTYHIYDHSPQHLPLFCGQAGEDITAVFRQELERHGQMVVLQHGLVVVHQGQLRAGVDQILVGETRVVHVVDGGGEDSGENLQRSEDRLQKKKKFKIQSHYSVK